jgi:hypothetical protein
MKNIVFLSVVCLFIVGILSYGCKKENSSDSESTGLPRVETTHALISATTAEISGIVHDSGSASVTEVGACFSTTSGATIGASRKQPGSGYPAFYSFITTLDRNTVYYVRTYAINAKGVGYGNEISFMTLDH